MAYVIAVLLGALFGAGTGGGFGVCAGALLGWLLVRSVKQQRELLALRGLVGEAKAGAPFAAPMAVPAIDSGAAMAASGQAVPVVPLDMPAVPVEALAARLAEAPLVDATASFTPAPTDREGPETVPQPEPVPAAATAVPPRNAPPPGTPFPSAPPAPSPFEPIRQWLLGGNTIVKAGVAILFVGLAFLAKYAAEHTQVPVEFRLAGIGLVAVVLLVFGWRLRLSRPGYAQVLQGGSIAVLYLTLFAAFRFYGVLAAGPAFGLMVAVAAFAAALAVLQDARSLAVIGALGGFATPLIVSTGSDNAAALFTYYFILDVGIAAVAWFRTWRSLNLVGFAFTFIVATAWGALRYRPESFAMSEGFLIAFFLLFVTILLLPARRLATGAPHRSDGWVNSSLLFGLPTITFALQYGLVRGTAYGAALSALVLAGFYVLLATRMKKRPELGITFDASLAIATVFLTLVIPFALDPRSTAGAWTLEAAGLVWIGLRQRRVLPRAFGYLLFIASVFSMLLAHQWHGDPHSVFNAYLFNGLMAAGAALAAAFFLHREQGGAAAKAEEGVEPLLIGLATLWLASTAALQISTFVADERMAAAALATLGVVAAFYALLAARLDWPGIAWPTAALSPLLFLGAAVSAVTLENPLHHGGWWAWPIAWLAHLAVLRLAARHWTVDVQRGVHAIGLVALALLGALLGRSLTADWGDADSAWPWLGWLVAPAVALLLLARPRVASTWPVRDAPLAYTHAGAGVLAAGLWLWTLVANVASDGTAAPLPHVPLVNPLDLGVALALVAIGLWLRAVGFANGKTLGALAAAGFVWLNAMLVRGFHHYGGVPYRVDAWLDSPAVQSGMALLWSLTALGAMWFATRRHQRAPWVVGASLLAAVVLKLLLVDLSGSGTVTRIVSFIGVGVLMLVIGYVAPLPAKEEVHVPA